MNKFIIPFLFLGLFLHGSEVSVFGAGDLSSKNPYGLNSSEKYILDNQKKINSLKKDLSGLNLKIKKVDRKFEGIESVSQGDSEKLNSAVLKVNKLIQKVEESFALASKNSKETKEIKSVSQQLLNMNEESEKEIKKSITALKAAVMKISKLVNKINSNYISSKELKSNMNQFVTRAEFNALKKALNVKTVSKKSKEKTVIDKKALVNKANLTGAEKSKLLEKAIAEYKRRYFNGAIPKFKKLVGLKYKPALGNYYLGEMWYVRKNYDLAINHFKTSAMLNDKAGYMPTLLLHSAVSFDKKKDFENAKSFYATLIDLYPESNESKTAQKKLAKLK